MVARSVAVVADEETMIAWGYNIIDFMWLVVDALSFDTCSGTTQNNNTATSSTFG